MSLHVLKRKTGTRYSGNHSNKEGFSLNNSRRLHTPQVSVQTPLKGTVSRGNGGCCGTYRTNIIYTQNVNSDPYNKTRPSVKSNSSYLNSKKKCQIQQLYTNSNRSCSSVNIYNSTEPINYQDVLNNKKDLINDCITSKVSGKCYTSTSNNVSTITKNIGTLDYSSYLENRLKIKECILAQPKRINNNTSHLSGCSNIF